MRDLPGESLVVDVDIIGKEVDQIFTKQPDLPAVIVADGEDFRGILSNTLFFRVMTRPFAREIYTSRPIRILMDHLDYEPLILHGSCPIPEAVSQGLRRSSELLYEPFVVSEPETDTLKVVSFQVLLQAASQIAALRSQQMERILHTISEGLMLIDRDGVIGAEFSAAVSRILMVHHLAGRRLD